MTKEQSNLYTKQEEQDREWLEKEWKERLNDLRKDKGNKK